MELYDMLTASQNMNITWHIFKRVLGGLIADKLIESTMPVFSGSLHYKYNLTTKGKKHMSYDIINLTTGEVLKEGVTRIEAITYAASWTDEFNYTQIKIDDDQRQVTIEQ